VRIVPLTAAALVLATAGTALADHVPGGSYAGEVTTGQGGTVALDVSGDGSTVDIAFNGLGNVAGTCTGVGFSADDLPITNHSFSYSANGGQITASGSFGPSSAGGAAQVLNTPCTTGSQAWFVAGPDGFLETRPGVFRGEGVLNDTGADQTQQRSVKRGKSAEFGIHVTNQGVDANAFNVKGCKTSKGFKVSYTDIGGNVTESVTEGSYGTVVLAPEAADDHELALKIKAQRSANPGKTKTCKVTTSSDLFVDVIKAKLRVKR
jgi:hypothetical protein